jgi:hypothetical protein
MAAFYWAILRLSRRVIENQGAPLCDLQSPQSLNHPISQ